MCNIAVFRSFCLIVRIIVKARHVSEYAETLAVQDNRNKLKLMTPKEAHRTKVCLGS